MCTFFIDESLSHSSCKPPRNPISEESVLQTRSIKEICNLLSHCIWKVLYKAALVFGDWLNCKMDFINCFIPEHQLTIYNDSESPKGWTAESDPSHPDISQSPQRTSQSSKQVSRGNSGLSANIEDMQEEQLKLSRFLSDPGTNKWRFHDEAYL